jgi:hypothetical protein
VFVERERGKRKECVGVDGRVGMIPRKGNQSIHCSYVCKRESGGPANPDLIV